MSNAMRAYQEITLRHSEEIPCNFLWEKLFQQVHLALVENKTIGRTAAGGSDPLVAYSEYGVSFPQYCDQLNALGCKLRIFASGSDKLLRLDLNRWLDGLRDYCRVSGIEAVPDEVEHVRFKRRQLCTGIERLARRRAKRKQESYEQALAYYSGFNSHTTRLPFIYMNSLSGKQRFPLFIEKEVAAHQELGEFSCYGLSITATVPWFNS